MMSAKCAFGLRLRLHFCGSARAFGPFAFGLRLGPETIGC